MATKKYKAEKGTDGTAEAILYRWTEMASLR